MSKQWIRLAPIMLAFVLIAVGCVPIATPPAQPSFPTGVFVGGGWKSEYNADGSYLSQSSTTRAQGTYTVTGDQVVLKDDYCGNVEGAYTWTFDGEALSFKTLDDQCVDRRDVVVGIPWLKQP